MKTTDPLISLAQQYARGIIRGSRTVKDAVAFIVAMKGEQGAIGAALFALEIASLLPDSAEVEFRRELTAALL